MFELEKSRPESFLAAAAIAVGVDAVVVLVAVVVVVTVVVGAAVVVVVAAVAAVVMVVAIVVANVVADVVAAVVDFSSPICFREMLCVSRKNPLFIIAPPTFFFEKKICSIASVSVSASASASASARDKKRRDFDDVKKATLQRDKQRMLAATRLRNILMSRFGLTVGGSSGRTLDHESKGSGSDPSCVFSLLLFSTKYHKSVSLLSGNCETLGILPDFNSKSWAR